MRLKGMLSGISVISLFAVIVSGCAVASTTWPASPTPGMTQAAKAAGGWQQEWDGVTAAARKEGAVVIASSAGSVIELFRGAFTPKYGINLELVSGKPAEIIPKVQAERRAGMYLVDVFMAGMGTVVPLLGGDDALERIDPALILPEVTDKKLWWNGDLLYTDATHRQVMFLAFPAATSIINSDLVGPTDVTSYRDLLDPKWKGKISYLDPTTAGNGNAFFVFAGETLGKDYLIALGKQDLVVTKDARLQTEWLARGKYPVAVGSQPELIAEFTKAGAPIKVKMLAEGTTLIGAGGGIVFLKNAPHPNAARVFVNWVLSKEAGTIAAKAFGAQSAREDVATDFLDPVMLRQPGVKYYSQFTEDAEGKKREYMQLAKEIWGDLLK